MTVLDRFLPWALIGLLLAVALAVSGCAVTPKIRADLHDDAAAAQAQAQAAAAAGDAQAAVRASCYAAWAAITMPAAAGGGPQLIFVPVETAIEVQATLQRPDCQQVAGQVLVGLVQKLPGL